MWTDTTLRQLSLAMGEILFGGDEDDQLVGGPGNDYIAGGGGNERIDGGNGDDTLYGGFGNDTLDGGSGDDMLVGGAGADTFVVWLGMGSDTITDFNLAEDRLDFSALSATERAAIVVSVNESGDRLLTLGDGSVLTLRGVPPNFAPTGEPVIGGVAAQGTALTADVAMIQDRDGLGAFSLQWLRDGAEIRGATGPNFVLTQADVGRAISLRVSYTDGFGALESLTSTQTSAIIPTDIRGTAGNDIIVGSDWQDTIYGFAGDDRLDGGAGDDVLYGGAGNDTMIGGLGNDTLEGGEGSNRLNGVSGNNLIYGGALRDLVYGGTGHDTIHGNEGNDELRGLQGDDLIFGGLGSDTLIGNEGNDTLSGEGGSDLIYGSDGDDFINGGWGHDRLNGGEGADTFFHLGVFDHGSDWIQDYSATEGDVLHFGRPGTIGGEFLVQYNHTANSEGLRAGSEDLREAFVTYRPTGQIIWALVDGEEQDSIVVKVGTDIFDLLA